MSRLSFFVAAAAVVLAGGAHAGGSSNRAWVSGHGVDAAGCGAPASPCRSLQFAHDNVVAAGGEIDILDPGGYGSIQINKAISIVNDGVGTAGVQASSGAAIQIQAGPTDAIYLRGLSIDGLRNAAGEGVLFQSGGSLTVVDCVIRHFDQSGVAILNIQSPAVTVLLQRDSLSDNAGQGLFLAPGSTGTVNAVIDQVTANHNGGAGFWIQGSDSGPTLTASISNSLASNNVSDGAFIEGAASADNTFVDISNSTFKQNFAGVEGQTRAVIHLSRSIMNANLHFGIGDNALSQAHFSSTGDNVSQGNGAGALQGGMTVDALQ